MDFFTTISFIRFLRAIVASITAWEAMVELCVIPVADEDVKQKYYAELNKRRTNKPDITKHGRSWEYTLCVAAVLGEEFADEFAEFNCRNVTWEFVAKALSVVLGCEVESDRAAVLEYITRVRHQKYTVTDKFRKELATNKGIRLLEAFQTPEAEGGASAAAPATPVVHDNGASSSGGHANAPHDSGRASAAANNRSRKRKTKAANASTLNQAVREYGGHGVAAVGASERGVGHTTRAAAPAAKKLRKTKKQDVKDEPRVENAEDDDVHDEPPIVALKLETEGDKKELAQAGCSSTVMPGGTAVKAEPTTAETDGVPSQWDETVPTPLEEMDAMSPDPQMSMLAFAEQGELSLEEIFYTEYFRSYDEDLVWQQLLDLPPSDLLDSLGFNAAPEEIADFLEFPEFP